MTNDDALFGYRQHGLHPSRVHDGRRGVSDLRDRPLDLLPLAPPGRAHDPETPFAKSTPDYIMRWLASRFLDVDVQEELGILTTEVRARKSAQEALSAATRRGRATMAETAARATAATAPRREE